MSTLSLWQERLTRNGALWEGEQEKMRKRQSLYLGEGTRLEPLTRWDRDKDGGGKKITHRRNIVSENIESMVSSSVPQPKVTARRREDEGKAKLIEDMLRNELDRLPFEELNDMMERTVPIQGGGMFLVEWDNLHRTHTTVGDINVRAVHPLDLIPQDGVTSLEDMDYFILSEKRTVRYVKERYGVTPEGTGDEEETVTVYTGYFKNGEGGIGRFTWCGDTALEELPDFESRRVRVCEGCGSWSDESVCPECGSKRFKTVKSEYEVVKGPIYRSDGSTVLPPPLPGEEQTVKIPYYTPGCYPLVLQKNISVYGRLLGDSDVDKIAHQQNTANRLEMKIIDRMIKAGTRITLPDRADLRLDPEDSERWYIGNAADKSCIGVYDFKGDLEYELLYLNQVYEEARQTLGITDSFQGRNDSTAESAVAKQFAAAQSAGRLESKRVMKNAAYAKLFELMFRYKLAYADEPREVTSMNERGETGYSVFNRYDFLETDDAGELYWNDRFLFSCDSSSPDTNNRQQMWESVTAHFTAGAFGDPRDPETLILYWTKLEMLHYPGAAETKRYLESRTVPFTV